MSQNFEESPVSDNKMDISSEPTSQESTSPVIENILQKTLETTKTTTITTNTGASVFTDSKAAKSTTGRTDGSITTAIKTDNDVILPNDSSRDQTMKLDNRCFDNDSPIGVLRLGQSNNRSQELQQQSQSNPNALRSELTVANSHPLMSPPGTDSSDSENGHRRVFSYPDIVPENEPLRLTMPPQSNRLMTNNKNLPTKVLNHSLDVTAICTTTHHRRRISLLREPSPDLLSSESEHDISQYQASVEPNYQSVALISNNLHRNIKMPSPKPLTRRKIPVSTELLSDDMSSLDSISNHSFDDDLEHNLASLSPSSSVLDGFNDKDDDFADLETPTNLPADPIPQYTAEDERRDSRNWQKITLPDGRTREIDMKVIEPYKRVLSHGGYLKAGGHNAIVMFCACHLPDRSRADYHYVMDNLFLYVVKTLEQLVTEDYVLIYLHGGSSRRNVPPFPWLKKCYQLLDRRLRKSLKNMYLVHPTFWLKSIVWMLRPFVSSKFWRKLIYVRSLEELYSLVPVEKASIPDKVKNYDSKYT